jgi:catechol 2,3-dioxygenase-like lactoylglutathione lyase family enzyme
MSLMAITGIFQVLATENLAASRAFYEAHFGMQAVFVADWYVHLAHPTLPLLQLGLIEAGHPSMPDADQRPNASTIVSMQVDDVDALHRALHAADERLLGEPRDEPWGQRHFLAIDPGGFFVDVVMPIQPAPDYAAFYKPL